MSAFIMGIKVVEFKLVFYTLINQLITTTITILIVTIILHPYLSTQMKACYIGLGKVAKVKGLE